MVQRKKINQKEKILKQIHIKHLKTDVFKPFTYQFGEGRKQYSVEGDKNSEK